VCHKSFEKDDEYLRAVLIMRRDVADQPAGEKLLESLYRAAARAEARAFSGMIYESFRDVDLVTPAGIYVGKAPAYVVDVPRLTRSLERITRGLFYHETKMPLPLDTRVTVDPDFERDKKLQEEIAQYVGGPLQHSIARNAFGYTFKQTPTSPFTSIWLLVFYGVAPYLVLTVRPPRTSES